MAKKTKQRHLIRKKRNAHSKPARTRSAGKRNSGIVLDERAQDQPADRKTAQRTSGRRI
jgi:hypothetical protein